MCEKTYIKVKYRLSLDLGLGHVREDGAGEMCWYGGGRGRRGAAPSVDGRRHQLVKVSIATLCLLSSRSI
jgi:hypothetical protein